MARAIAKAMAKSRIEHVCTDCGATHTKWAGQCSSCGQWNTLVEEVAVASAPTIPAAGPASRIGDVDPLTSRPRATCIGELDRVLGGGLVAGVAAWAIPSGTPTSVSTPDAILVDRLTGAAQS